MRRVCGIIVGVGVLVGGWLVAVQAATTTIGPGDNLAAAIARLQPGDTLTLRGGTYGRISTDDGAIPSGQPGAPITIAAVAGERVTLRSIGLSSYGSAGASYLVFQDLHVDGGGGSGGIGVFGTGVHHIRFQGGSVSHVTPPSRCNAEGNCYAENCVSGFAGTHHIEFSGLEVFDCGQNRFDHGFYFSAPDSLIENVDVHHSAGYGLHIYDSACRSYAEPACPDRMVLRNNRVHHNRGDGGVTLNHGAGIQFCGNVVQDNVGNGVEVSWGSPANTVLTSNTVVGNGGTGLSIRPEVSATRVERNLFSGQPVSIDNHSDSTTFAGNRCDPMSPGCEPGPAADSGASTTTVCGGPPPAPIAKPRLPAPKNLRLLAQP